MPSIFLSDSRLEFGKSGLESEVYRDKALDKRLSLPNKTSRLGLSVCLPKSVKQFHLCKT